jgi:hypothetical protein
MKLMLAILFLAALVVAIALAVRRGSPDTGYRRRFENRYRRDTSGDTGTPVPMFVAGLGDSGTHYPAHGHSHDCGAHVGHSDGGAASCGDGGSN